MIVWLSVRLGDAVTSGESSYPIRVDGLVRRFMIAFRPGDEKATLDRAFVGAMREVLERSTVRLYVKSAFGTYLALESECVYEIPTLAPGRTIEEVPGLPEPPWEVKRGDVLRLQAIMKGEAPTTPVIMRAIFDIEEAPAPALH
jgi:hypothetical protein